MKVSELQKILKKINCYIIRHGSRHDIWYSPVTGKQFPVPRHPSQDVKREPITVLKRMQGFSPAVAT